MIQLRILQGLLAILFIGLVLFSLHDQRSDNLFLLDEDVISVDEFSTTINSYNDLLLTQTTVWNTSYFEVYYQGYLVLSQPKLENMQINLINSTHWWMTLSQDNLFNLSIFTIEYPSIDNNEFYSKKVFSYNKSNPSNFYRLHIINSDYFPMIYLSFLSEYDNQYSLYQTSILEYNHSLTPVNDGILLTINQINHEFYPIFIEYRNSTYNPLDEFLNPFSTFKGESIISIGKFIDKNTVYELKRENYQTSVPFRSVKYSDNGIIILAKSLDTSAGHYLNITQYSIRDSAVFPLSTISSKIDHDFILSEILLENNQLTLVLSLYPSFSTEIPSIFLYKYQINILGEVIFENYNSFIAFGLFKSTFSTLDTIHISFYSPNNVDRSKYDITTYSYIINGDDLYTYNKLSKSLIVSFVLILSIFILTNIVLFYTRYNEFFYTWQLIFYALTYSCYYITHLILTRNNFQLSKLMQDHRDKNLVKQLGTKFKKISRFHMFVYKFHIMCINQMEAASE